jgi:membrane-associated phospholipid phosphatase
LTAGASPSVRILGLGLRPADAVALGGSAVLVLLAAVFRTRLADPWPVIGRHLLFVLLYLAAVAVLPRLRSRWLRFLIRTGSVQILLLQIYLTSRDLQLLFFGWNDETVLRWESALFETQPLVWIQKLYSPLLSDWMFFVYVAYIVIYPLLGAVIYFRRGEAANEDYLFGLGLVNLLCGWGFILFPVKGPLHWESVRGLLTEPLPVRGFGQAAEYIRTHFHAPGGTIPSPHCAAATVMWFMAKTHTRWGFWILSPIVLSVYLSTVYGRFHYFTDVVIGIAVAVPVLLISPVVRKAWGSRAGRRSSEGP